MTESVAKSCFQELIESVEAPPLCDRELLKKSSTNASSSRDAKSHWLIWKNSWRLTGRARFG